MKLFVPIICYNHTCHTSYMMSMIRLILFCSQNRIECTLYPITFESLVSRARNAAVAHFLSDPDATHLLFIDSDIEFQPSDVLALMNANKDVVCGSYPQKWFDLTKYNTAQSSTMNPIHPCMKHSVHIKDVPKTETALSEPLSVIYATTGFLLIKRNVFEQIAASYPERQYRNDVDGYNGADPKRFFDFFPVTIEPTTRRYESEDYGFSRLWTSIGGQIFVIPNITLRHHGWYAYEGNLKNSLEAERFTLAHLNTP